MKYMTLDPSWKKCSDVAPYRKQLADALRAARRKDPRIARLLLRRIKETRQKMAEYVFTQAVGTGLMGEPQ